jgi:ribosome-associated protein
MEGARLPRTPWPGRPTAAAATVIRVGDSLRISDEVSVPLAEIELRASRSSGPGGQHANVTASRVEAVFEIAASTSLTDEHKQRLSARFGPRVTAIAQDARGQARNRELALERLRAKLAAGLTPRRPRRATRPSKAARERRLESKRRRAQRKRERQPPGDE